MLPLCVRQRNNGIVVRLQPLVPEGLKPWLSLGALLRDNRGQCRRVLIGERHWNLGWSGGGVRIFYLPVLLHPRDSVEVAVCVPTHGKINLVGRRDGICNFIAALPVFFFRDRSPLSAHLPTVVLRGSEGGHFCRTWVVAGGPGSHHLALPELVRCGEFYSPFLFSFSLERYE